MGEQKKEELFNRYARNWTLVKNALEPRLRVEPDIDGVFICPLCFRYFSFDALKDNTLTLEHVPPQKAGGQIRTLTCQPCNNDYGRSKLESQLAKKLEYEEFASGNSGFPLKAVVIINNDLTHLPVDVFLGEANQITIIPPARVRAKSKPQIEKFTQQFQNDDLKFTLRFKPYSPKYASIAILRAAYLWAFSFFGYSFLINPSLKAVRGQIQHPEETILPTLGIIKQDFPDRYLGVSLIETPKEMRSFLVVFDMFSKQTRPSRYGVVLPGPSLSGMEMYKWLLEHEKTPVTYDVSPITDDLDFLEHPLAALDLWNDFEQDS